MSSVFYRKFKRLSGWQVVNYIEKFLEEENELEITEDDETPSCRVTVPDHQLSLAIGNKGQNARLAARLTGWKIDIRPESGFFGEDDEEEA